MRKPINNETNLINQIWNNSSRLINEQAVPGQFPSQSPEYDIDSLDLSDYTPEQQAEIKKQLKAQNFTNSIQSIAKPGSVPPADQKGVQKALRANKNVAVDKTGKKWFISDLAKNLDWEPSEEPETTSEPTSSEQPMDAATREFKAADSVKKSIPSLNWAQLTADALNKAKNANTVESPFSANFMANDSGQVAQNQSAEKEERDNQARRDSLKGRTDVMGTVEYPDSVFTNYEKEQQAAKEKAQAKYRGMLPGANWAQLAADGIKNAKAAAKENEGPTLEISDQDLETDGVVTVDMRDAWGSRNKKSSSNSNTPNTNTTDDSAESPFSANFMANDSGQVRQNQAAEREERKSASTPQPKPIITPVIKSPEELYGRKLAKGDITADEYRRLMGDDADTDTSNYQKELDKKVQTGKVSMPYSERAPLPGESLGKTPIAWPSEKKPPLPSMPVGSGVLLPQAPEQPMDAAVKQQKQAQALGWKSGSEQQTAVDALGAKLDKAIEGIKDVQKTAEETAKIREANKKFVASQSPEIQAAMEREAKAEAAKQRMFDRLAGKPETSNTTMQAPSAVKSDSSGRDTKNIVPGSAMWGELSSSEKKQIADRYSRGEGPSISVRYNKNTGKFDEPGYGDQGQYGDIVKALNTVNESFSVNRYCQFITEMARAKSGTTKPKTEEKPKATKPKTEEKPKTQKKSEVTPAETKPAVATTPAPASTPTAKPIPPALQRPVHGGRLQTASVQPPVASMETSTPAQPVAAGNPAFPKLPEGYKGNIKYKLGKTSVSTDFSNPVPVSGYVTPQTPNQMNALERYVAGSQFTGTRQNYFGHLKNTEGLVTVIEPKSKPEPVVVKPSGTPVRVVSSKPSNILSNTGKAVGVGLGLAGLITAGAALTRGQTPTNIKSGAAPQVNTEDTPRVEMDVSEIVKHSWQPEKRKR